MKRILGISAYYHDSAAALLVDGQIAAAAQEERFSRQKHDAAFPASAVRSCLGTAGLSLGQIDAVVFYEKPWLKFERILETYLAVAPRGLGSFLESMPVWIKDKLFLKTRLRQEFTRHFGLCPPLFFSEHHRSHAASAFFPSPFEESAVLCLDGVGEWATTSAWSGKGAALTPLWEIAFPHSLGLLYSAFTAYAGFKLNSGEHKLMGLAPLGKPHYVDTILTHLIDVKPDGTFRLNMDYFGYCTQLQMTNRRFEKLFGGPARVPESEITQKEKDLAASVQAVTEQVLLKLCHSLQRETGARSLCLAGGVALNCVANGRLAREKIFDKIWIQPAPGDAGGALGAALVFHHEREGHPRVVCPTDSMQGAYLGPAFDEAQITQALDALGARYEQLDDAALLDRASASLADGKVVGWFQGRMEFGPRSLGNRSLLADARSPQMQGLLNSKIKRREGFRPFGPAVLHECAADFFELPDSSPYMLFTAPVKQAAALASATHVDGSARVQTVSPEANPRFHRLLERFQERTQTGVLINTSFNVRGEPVVCTPSDAYACFMATGIDVLVMGNAFLQKAEQRGAGHGREFALD